jgi:hypothetical protein
MEAERFDAARTLAKDSVKALSNDSNFPIDERLLLSTYEIERLSSLVKQYGRNSVVAGMNAVVARWNGDKHLEPELPKGKDIYYWPWFEQFIPKPEPAPAPRKPETDREWRARMDALRRKNAEEKIARREAWARMAEPLVAQLKAAGFTIDTKTTKSRGDECALLTPSQLDDLYGRFPREALLGGDMEAVLQRAVTAFIASPGKDREGNTRTRVTAWSNLGEPIRQTLALRKE